MGFLDKKKNEEWIEGTPESFKVWFWIRLAVSLYVGYIGVDLIIRYVRDGMAWWYLLIAGFFLIVAVVFLIWDIRGYIRLRRHLKARREAEEAGEIEKPKPKPVREENRLNISEFAKYSSKEDEADDEV